MIKQRKIISGYLQFWKVLSWICFKFHFIKWTIQSVFLPWKWGGPLSSCRTLIDFRIRICRKSLSLLEAIPFNFSLSLSPRDNQGEKQNQSKEVCWKHPGPDGEKQQWGLGFYCIFWDELAWNSEERNTQIVVLFYPLTF